MRAIGKIFKWLFITLFTFLVIGILTAFIFGSLFLSYVKNDIMTSDETILNLETMPVNLSSTIYYKDPEHIRSGLRSRTQKTENGCPMKISQKSLKTPLSLLRINGSGNIPVLISNVQSLPVSTF